MKFFYSDTGKVLAVQPADGRFYPFSSSEFTEDDFTEEEFLYTDYHGADTLADLADLEPHNVDSGENGITSEDLVFTNNLVLTNQE